MQMKKISVVNIKGGVGKTQTTINLAGELAKQGHKTLVIDGDSQCNTTQILNATDAEATLYDVYTDRRVGFNECIYEIQENLYLVPNSKESKKLENELNIKKDGDRVLKDKMDTLPDIFDFIIIDNPPLNGVLAKNSLIMSDYYLAVMDNSASSIQGLNDLKNLIKEIKEDGWNEDVKCLGILRNRFDKVSRFTKSFNEVLEENFSEDLLQTIVYNSVKYKEAVALHQTIQDYNKKAAKPYENLVKEIEKRY